MKARKIIIKNTCDKCSKDFAVTGKIQVTTYNPWQRYNKSNLPIRDYRKVVLCKKHFKEFQQKINKLITEY
jgi:hypothetical protein